MIKDSACAVNRSSWGTMFDGCAFRSRYGKGPPPYKKRIYKTRTVAAYLEPSPVEIRILVQLQDEEIFNSRTDNVWNASTRSASASSTRWVGLI